MSGEGITREETLKISLKLIELAAEQGNKEIELNQTFDAALWASEFCARHPEADFEEMSVSFANALMTGYDFRRFHMEDS